MKVQIVLIIALVILNFVQGQNDTTIGCQRAETTIKEVLKSTVEELYQKQCPSGWYRILDSCIFVPQETLNFDEASQRCGQLASSARLFEPMSKMQNNIVHTLIKEVYGLLDLPNRQNFWIGITDREVEGQFLYESSGAPLAFQNWGEQHNEPNGGPNENCLGYYSDWYQHGELNDLPCSTITNFVCEKPLLL